MREVSTNLQIGKTIRPQTIGYATDISGTFIGGVGGGAGGGGRWPCGIGGRNDKIIALPEQIRLLEGKLDAATVIIAAISGDDGIHDVPALDERGRGGGHGVAIGEDRLNDAGIDTEMRLIGISEVAIIVCYAR